MRSFAVLTLILLFTNLSIAAEEPAISTTYGQPLLITPAGQSAEGFMIRTMCLRLGIDVTYRPQANKDSIKDVKTILLVAGGSSKGLGAAKINEEDEIKRIEELVTAAKKADIRVITFHIGGKARRGPLSDGFNKLAADDAELIVAKQDGDDDGFFKKIAEDNKARYISVGQPAEVMGVLKELFIPMSTTN